MRSLRRQRRQRCWRVGMVVLACAMHASTAVAADQSPTRDAPSAAVVDTAFAGTPAAASNWPMLLGAQYTYVLQHQSALRSPYQGPLSLRPQGDTQPTNTIGFYGGWAAAPWAQLYLDGEKFMGASVSGGTGLAGLSNGDVVREGAQNLPKEFYIARLFARFMLPLGTQVEPLERGQDQLPGTEAVQRLELKVGRMAVPDDFDKNRYAGAARTQFLNWSLWDNTAWDYAANTRGYTDGIVLGYLSPGWSVKYGIYRMPLLANAQPLERSLSVARGENLELTLSAWPTGTIVRVLAYRNTARMGDYEEALAVAAASGTVPNIVADDRDGRHKFGFGINAEQPLADDGESGLFMRLGWNDGKTETFVFTEVDRLASFGGQLSGVHWSRAQDRLGVGMVVEGLSDPHREYLAAGGCGFVLCDARLDYAHEQILEVYYRAQLASAVGRWPIRVQLSPDFQYARSPGYNSDRGPVRFYGVRLHVEY
jgi:high affinity Mn2+ porin